MPFADNDGIRIHYHVEGEGAPLIMQHGFTSSIKNWYTNGYVEPLKQDYRLILVDARGHGESDKPHDAAQYDIELRVGDIMAVLDAVGIDKAHYMGYSMGGRIGFGVAQHAPERVLSMTIGGMHPYESGGNATPNDRVALLKQGMEAYVASMEQNGPIDPVRRERLLANDAEALIAAISAPRGTTGDILPNMKMPCLLYVGEADGFYDGAMEAVKHIPDVTFVSFPGLDHGQVSASGSLVVPHVQQFLSRVTAQAAIAG